MTYVKTLEDFTPAERFDGNPWTAARIEETLSLGTPPLVVETIPLVPLDADPRFPQARDLTTTLASLPAGWIRVVFVDEIGREGPTDWVWDGGTIEPAVHQIAMFLGLRTGEPGGGFSADTTPSEDEVEGYVQSTTADVIATIGRDVPAASQDLARKVIEVGAAMLVELNADPPHLERYDRLKVLYNERLARLIAAVIAAGGTVPLPVDPTPVAVQFSGPPYPLGIITGRGDGGRGDWD